MIVSNGNNDHYTLNKKSIKRNLNLSYQARMKLIKSKPKKIPNIKINNYPMIQIINQTSDNLVSYLESNILQNNNLMNSKNNVQMQSNQNKTDSKEMGNRNKSVIDIDLCNHRIDVEKKFYKSVVNKNYVFPKKFYDLDFEEDINYENEKALDLFKTIKFSIYDNQKNDDSLPKITRNNNNNLYEAKTITHNQCSRNENYSSSIASLNQKEHLKNNFIIRPKSKARKMINKTSAEDYRKSPESTSPNKKIKLKLTEKKEEIHLSRNCENKLNIWNSFIDNMKININNELNESNNLTLSPIIALNDRERNQKTTFSKYPVKLKYQNNEIVNIYKLLPKTMKNNKTNRNYKRQAGIPCINLLHKQAKKDENNNFSKFGTELENIQKNLRKNLYCSSLIYQRNPSPPKMQLNISNFSNERNCLRNKPLIPKFENCSMISLEKQATKKWNCIN